MRKILFSILITIFSVNIFSDDHGIKPGNVVAEFHYFDVLDPAAFVSAMDTFYLSDCAKRWHSESGAQVALMGITGSGWTHFIYVGYENLAQMEKGRGLLQCPDFLSMLVSIRKASNETEVYAYTAALILKEMKIIIELKIRDQYGI